MFRICPDRKRITMHKGDTGTVQYRMKNYDLSDVNAVVVWTMKDKKKNVVKSGIYFPVDNRIQVHFQNSDTDGIDPGIYRCDARIAIDPEYDTSGKVADGSFINTPVSPMYIEVLDVVGDI